MIALDQHLTGHKEDITQQWLEVCTSNGKMAVFSERSAKTRTKVKRPA